MTPEEDVRREALIAELEALLLASRANRTVLYDLLVVVTERLGVLEGRTTPNSH